MKSKNIFLTLAVMFFVVSNMGQAFAIMKGDRSSQLYDAIYTKNFNNAKMAVSMGANVNEINDRDTMLGWSIRQQTYNITKLLLDSPKIDVNLYGETYDSFGWMKRTPLILASAMGEAEIVDQLLKKGAKPNLQWSTSVAIGDEGRRGSTAIVKAAENNKSEVIKVLLAGAKGLNPNAQTKEGFSALWYVSEHGNLPMVKLLNKYGAKINTVDRDGNSVLITTFYLKNHDVAEYLVANGANVNQLSSYGTTPLMTAVTYLADENSKQDIIQSIKNFLSFKPKLDLQRAGKEGNGGYGVLHLVARGGYTEVAKMLLDEGANINLKSIATGGTPLHFAAGNKQIEMVKYLVKRDANLEIFDKTGSTPLMVAVYQQDVDIVQALVEGGADINKRSSSNVMMTPLVQPASDPNPNNKSENYAILKYLLSHGADINFQTANGLTALMGAARQSDTSLGYNYASLLVDKDANLDIANDKGETALMLAAGAGNTKLVKLLMKKGADADMKNGAGETIMNYANRARTGGSASYLKSAGVKSAAPIVREKVIVNELIGTWQGYQDGLPSAIFTYVLGKNGKFSFNSKLTPEIMKQFPKGAMKETIASQKGTYTFSGSTMILDLVGAPPTSMKWELSKGVLIIDNKIRLKKVK